MTLVVKVMKLQICPFIFLCGLWQTGADHALTSERRRAQPSLHCPLCLCLFSPPYQPPPSPEFPLDADRVWTGNSSPDHCPSPSTGPSCRLPSPGGSTAKMLTHVSQPNSRWCHASSCCGQKPGSCPWFLFHTHFQSVSTSSFQPCLDPTLWYHGHCHNPLTQHHPVLGL